MLKIIDKTSQHGIDIKSIPFAIYSPQFNDDLSQFLGNIFLTQRLEILINQIFS